MNVYPKGRFIFVEPNIYTLRNQRPVYMRYDVYQYRTTLIGEVAVDKENVYCFKHNGNGDLNDKVLAEIKDFLQQLKSDGTSTEQT